jgi:hypothetical protein
MKHIKLKVDDRVCHHKYKKCLGTVFRVRKDLSYPIYVRWDTKDYDDCYKEFELKLVEEPIIDVDDLFEGIDI